jgi:hypothetical protein
MGQALTYIPIFAAVLFPFGDQDQIRDRGAFGRGCLRSNCLVCGRQNRKDKTLQQERVNVVLDPDSADPRGYGYHTVQSNDHRR